MTSLAMGGAICKDAIANVINRTAIVLMNPAAERAFVANVFNII